MIRDYFGCTCFSCLYNFVLALNREQRNFCFLNYATLCFQTPLNWQEKWDGPEDPFQYLRGLVSRAVAVQTWVDKAQNNNLLRDSLDLSELFRPDTFLNALRQQTAR